MPKQAGPPAAKCVEINAPLRFDPAGKGGDRISVYANGVNAPFFAFHEGRACADERVKHCRPNFDAEPLKVGGDEVIREGQNEAIPVVNGGVGKLIGGCAIARRGGFLIRIFRFNVGSGV